MGECLDRQVGGYIDGWLDRQMDGQMGGGWRDGWRDCVEGECAPGVRWEIKAAATETHGDP